MNDTNAVVVGRSIGAVRIRLCLSLRSRLRGVENVGANLRLDVSAPKTCGLESGPGIVVGTRFRRTDVLSIPTNWLGVNTHRPGDSCRASPKSCTAPRGRLFEALPANSCRLRRAAKVARVRSSQTPSGISFARPIQRTRKDSSRCHALNIREGQLARRPKSFGPIAY